MITGQAWNDVNMLLGLLRNEVEIIDAYYLRHGNPAPGELYRQQIEKVQKHLDEDRSA